MSDFKLKCRVIVVERTDEPTEMVLAINIRTKKIIFGYRSQLNQFERPFFLFLVSDQLVKVGDLVMNTVSKEMWTASENDVEALSKMEMHSTKKIEATNHPKLPLMPRIPDAFIDKYRGKIFDVTQVNLDSHLLLGDVDFTNPNFPKFRYSITTRTDKTVIMTRVDPIFTYEDMEKAFRYGRLSNENYGGFSGLTVEDFMSSQYDFDIPKS